MAEVRLPAHVEVGGLVRRINAEGGFAMVIRKGEPDAGTILIVLVENGMNPRVYERMPQVDGKRKWTLIKSQVVEKEEEVSEYLARRSNQDRDLWIVELDIPDGERFIPES